MRWLIYLLSITVFVAIAQPGEEEWTPRELTALFELPDLFEPGAVAVPFDDPAVFPYWVLSAEGYPIAVIEAIVIDAEDGRVLLDAQYLDGNDFKASTPVIGAVDD